jgi:hypothetical protein
VELSEITSGVGGGGAICRTIATTHPCSSPPTHAIVLYVTNRSQFNEVLQAACSGQVAEYNELSNNINPNPGLESDNLIHGYSTGYIIIPIQTQNVLS